jgi:hypothetical protein
LVKLQSIWVSGVEIVHSLPLTTCGSTCGDSRKIGPLEETADMRRNPAALHGRCRSYREQSREHLFYNELDYALKIGRLSGYNVPQLALISSSDLFSDEVST